MKDYYIENETIDELLIQVVVGMTKAIYKEFHESFTVELEFIITNLETNEEYSEEVFVHELLDEQIEYNDTEL